MVLQINLLDGLKVDKVGTPSPLLKSPKVLALLFYLLIAQKPVRRGTLADLLWDNTVSEQSLRNLRALLFRARKTIPQIQTNGDWITFEPGLEDEIDLFQLTENLESNDPQKLDSALQKYRHDLLRDFYLPGSPRYNEWLTVEREYLRRQVLRAYERLCEVYEKQGHWQSGMAAAQRWLEMDPYSEEAYYYLIVCLASIGQVRLAQGQYRRYRQIITEQLNLEPTPKMVTLFEKIRSMGRASGDPALVRADRSSVPVFLPDWGEAPAATAFSGRQDELVQLESWLLEAHCPVVIILGIGGQGKTTLAAQVARSLADHFDGVIWRSLLNAPLPEELLADLLGYFSPGQVSELPHSFDVRLAALSTHLKSRRFLVILDNLESVLSGEVSGHYHEDYVQYIRLFQVFSQGLHQSCLMLTSREKPLGLDQIEREVSKIRSLHLAGLPAITGSEMLLRSGVSGSTKEMTNLVERYSGNPLALKLVAQTVKDFYGGNISDFLQDETAIFEDVRTILDQQFERLTSLEQEILLWLAIERDPTNLPALQARLLHPPRQRSLIEALYSLQRRSLVEKFPHGFGLQNVILEYLTDHLTERISQEIQRNRTHYLRHFALQPADSREYIRLSQKRRILQPIGEFLQAELGPKGVAAQFKQVLFQLHALAGQQQGYAAGNILNLALHLGLDPAQFDFSHLKIWQVDLQGVDLSGVNMMAADLSGSNFTDLFGFVYAVCFSPNGQLLAAGSADGRIHVWRVATGQSVLTLQAHEESVWGVAFSPDGRMLASCSADGSVRLWDSNSGVPGPVLARSANRDGVLAVAFHPAEDILVSADESGWIWVWNAQNGELLHTIKGHTAYVQDIVFSPDGLWLASGGRDQCIHLWSVETLKTGAGEIPTKTFTGHTGWISALAFSPDSRTLASAGEDMTIGLWELRSGTLRQTILGHTAGIHALAFSPDGNFLASGGNDHSVRLWEASNGQIHHIFSGHTNWVYSLAFSPDSKLLASGSWDQSVRLWDVHKQYAMQTYRGHMRWVFGLAFSPDGRTLASASSEKKVRLWNVEDGQVSATFSGHTDSVWNVAFTPHAAVLASISMDHTIRLWDLEVETLLCSLRGHQDGLQSLAISPDGNLLATGGLDHLIVLWDIRDIQHNPQQRVLRKMDKHTGWCLGLDFSPDGRTLASGSADRTVRLWDVHSGKCLQVLEGHTDGVQQVFFSPDGSLLASASWDKTAVLWDVASGKTIHRLEGHTGILRALAFSPDGQLLATGGNDQTIRLWEISSGRLYKEIYAHDNWVFHLVFSPDGQLLASASGDETIKLWKIPNGTLQQTWQVPGPYNGLDLRGAVGLSESQVLNLKALGAIA